MADAEPKPAPHHHASGAEPARPLPPRVTTPLLALITQQSLDEDYQHVADQRAAAVGAEQAAVEGRTRGRSRTTVVVLAAFGVLIAVAAVTSARNADVDSAGRLQLVDRITQRRENVEDLQTRLDGLRRSNTNAERSLTTLRSRMTSAESRRTTLARVTGYETVRGPGVRAVVDDAPGGDPDGQVRDEDLALLVNALWEAGAEAVSVNGQRMSALSALRNSGRAIRVNDVSLSPPYVLLALGDTRTLQAGIAASTSGQLFEDLTRRYGMRFEMDNVDGLEVGAAPQRLLTLRHAERLVEAPAEVPPSKKEQQEETDVEVSP